MLFEPAEDNNLPDGLEMFPALVDVPARASKVARIPIQDSTHHDIFLPLRTVLGHIESITDSTPVIFTSTQTGGGGGIHACSAQLGKMEGNGE